MDALGFLARATPAPEPTPPSPDPEIAAPAPAERPGQALHATLLSRGHRLLTREGKLFVTHARWLSDDERTAIKAQREDLMALADPWDGQETPTINLEQEWITRVTNAEGDSPSVHGGLTGLLMGAAPLPPREPWILREPPSLDGIHDICLNFECNGLDWRRGDEPIGVTIGTLDGHLRRFLPFGFQGSQNLDRAAVIRYLQTEVRDKNITNANTRFDIHMGRPLGVDFEGQGNTVSDVMHYAALLDDHRKRFALDVLAQDLLGGVAIPRVNERVMAQYDSAQVAARAEYQVQLVAELRNKMWPLLDAEGLQDVRALEDAVIYPVVEMEKNGSPIDVPLMEEMQRDCLARYGRLMMEIATEAGFAFEHTPTGWGRLFEKCGVPPSDSYKEEILAPIDHPLIKKAYHAGQLASLNSKVFAAYPKHIHNGVLYYDINQLRGDDGGTVSGRFSIGLVQQVPNHDNHHAAFGEGDADACHGRCDFFPRRLFTSANPDTLPYFESDAAQIEFRLLAHFANNRELLAAYAENPRMSYHKKMWAMLKTYRPAILYTHTKSFNFAYQYGAKSIKLAVMMNMITAAEGEEIRAAKNWNDPRLDLIHEIEDAYKKAVPEGAALIERAAHLAKPECDKSCRKGDALHREYEHRGYVKTIMGRRSRFPNTYKTYIAWNRVVQGSGADILKKKAAILHRERKHTGFLMRLTVHDAFTGDAQLGTETQRRVDEILNEQSFPLRVPVLWESNTGRNWASCK